MTETGAIRIGISGWTFAPWRGVFYPKGTTRKRELAYASRQFPSIEINGTFYGLQRPEAFAKWRDETPDGFVFAVKGSRYITHMRRLRDVETPLANFMASGLLRLGRKLGPILWQFPPRLRFDPELFSAFMAMLPKDTRAAARVARGRDARLEGRDWLETDENRPLRHAFEIRNESFEHAAFIRLLREHKMGLVCADTVEWPLLMDLTADFVYCRLHGSEELYVSGYDDKALDIWARRISAWAHGLEPADAKRVLKPLKSSGKGRDVYVYFDNDVKVRAPVDARRLAERLGLASPLETASPPARKPQHKPEVTEEARQHWPAR
ncbi:MULTISPECIES: DUF72 domain-containing protein [unclassified Rhizobium]|uniref:DUF72 domain-containing protein n=1 Tax=unclassified Rhizobium TaxID=2613769 RepID=UPI000EA96022|nr:MULTISPECIES: DUF72 domain-containing protein [unclassified Rhizobium]AYG69199.1 DUF72 domain-containing protein [Rhizobium sp. CCGE531]AYG75579.1 DUF72 domain-containing protein [Rhizobium sp. CCGE532]